MSIKGLNKPIELAERKSPAVLTGILIILVLVCSYPCISAHSALWLHEHVFQANKILSMIDEQQYNKIWPIIFYTNFTTINLWQLVFSLYFLFTFGLAVESRLGPTRFVILILMSATIPWITQYWDILNNPVWHVYFEHPKADTYFFGPGFILVTLACAYMKLIPQQSSHELYVPQSGKERRSKLFNRSKPKEVTEYFGLPSELFLSTFVIYELVQRAFIILPWQDLDTMGLYGFTAALLIGWVFSAIVLRGLNQSFTDHPLKHEAVKRYYELLDLDVDSANAIKGAAKAVGLPDDQIQLWVSETKGKLRTK